MIDGTGMCGGCRVERRRQDAVRVRRRPRVRRPRGGLRPHDAPAGHVHGTGASCLRRIPSIASRIAAGCEPQLDGRTRRRTALSQREARSTKKQRLELPPAGHAGAAGRASASATWREVRAGLHAGAGGAGSRALPAVHELAVRRRLPGGHRHPALHRAGRGRRLRPRPRTIRERNLLPAICGRVCPQEEQCQVVCSVTKALEVDGDARSRSAGSSASWPTGSASNGARHGPESRAAHGQARGGRRLRPRRPDGGRRPDPHWAMRSRSSRRCTGPGGVLTYGIPEFRLPKEIVCREVDIPRASWASSSATTSSSARRGRIERPARRTATTRSSSAPAPACRTSWTSRARTSAACTRPTST